MVLKEDKERIRTLLSETIALMCKSGLHFKAEFSVEALVGITLDHGDEFFLSIRETVLSDVAPPTEPTCSPILSDNNDSCSDDNADVKKSGRKSSQVRHVVGRDPARPSDGAEREGSPVTDDWSSAAADENSGVGTRWTGHKRPKSRPSDRASPPKRRHVDEETGGEGEERGAGREAGRGVVKLEASQSEAQDSEDDCVYVKDEPLSDRGEGDTDTAELNWDTSDLSYSFGSAPSSYDPNSTANASMVSSFTGPTVDGVGAPGIVETGPPPPGHGHRIPISYHQARGPLWKSVPDVQFSGMLPVDGSTGGLDMLNSASTSDSSLNQPDVSGSGYARLGHNAGHIMKTELPGASHPDAVIADNHQLVYLIDKILRCKGWRFTPATVRRVKFNGHNRPTYEHLVQAMQVLAHRGLGSLVPAVGNGGRSKSLFFIKTPPEQVSETSLRRYGVIPEDYHRAYYASLVSPAVVASSGASAAHISGISFQGPPSFGNLGH